MIVSRQLELIFVKTRKTAGTAIEIALSRCAGPDDIITPFGNETDEQARAIAGGRSPQNFHLSPEQMPQSLLTTSSLSNLTLRNHEPARRIRQVVGESTWKQYLTFTVVRNPWDRAVSMYYFRTRPGPRPAGQSVEVYASFSEFLRGSPTGKLSNFDLYAIDGAVGVNRVVRYEQLITDLERIWSDAGIQLPVDLPRTKGNFRPADAIDYRRMFNDADAEFIANVCSLDIAAHGYSF